MKVIEKATGREIKPGDQVTSFRGEKATFRSVTRGPAEGRTAKVYVHTADGNNFEFNASVYGLEVSE